MQLKPAVSSRSEHARRDAATTYGDVAAPREFRLAARLSAVRRRLFAFAALTLLAWLPLSLWFGAFKPGIMTGDSLGAWWQASTGRVSDDITPSYTFLMKLSLLASGSPSALALGQQLLLSMSVVAVAISLIQLGARRWLVFLVSATLLLSPMVGAFSVSIWKDVPYSAAVLFCGAAILQLLRLHLSGARSAKQLQLPLAMLFVAASAAVIIRQNGLFFALSLGLILFIALKGARRWVAGGIGVVICVLLMLKLVIYPAVDVAPSSEQLKYASLLHDVGAVIHHSPERVPDAATNTLESMAPLQTWSDAYSCYTVNPLYYHANLNFDPLNRNPSRFRSMWFDLLRSDLPTVIGHRWCAASVAWRPAAVGRSTSVLYTVSAGIDPNGYGLVTTPLSPTLHDWGSHLIDTVNEPTREWYLWRAPTWIYICYVGLATAALRNRSAWYLLPGAPLLAQQLGVSVINPAQDARYMMGALMLAVLLLPVATLRHGDLESRSRHALHGRRRAGIARPSSGGGAPEESGAAEPAEEGTMVRESAVRYC